MSTIFHRLSQATPVEKEEPEAPQRTIFHELAERPPTKAEKIASREKFFGKEIFTPELVESLRRKSGLGLKELTGGLLGTPGDILQFFQKILRVKKPKEILPTSETIGKGFEKLAREEFKPETTGEEYLERGAGYLGSILSLGGPLKGATAAKGLGRTLMAAFVPSSVSLATEKADLPAPVRIGATIGSAILTNRITGKSLRQVNKELYQQAEKIAANETVDATRLSKNLSSLESSLEKGISTTPKSAVKSSIKELKGKIENGKIAVDDLIAAKRDINSKMGEFITLKGAKKLYGAVAKNVDKTVQEFEAINPQFKEVYRHANSLYKGINEARYVENFIKNKPLLAAEAALFLNLTKFVTGKAGLISAPILKAGEFAVALARNPGLRKSYYQVLKDAAANDARGTLNSLKKFNKEIEEKSPELLSK